MAVNPIEWSALGGLVFVARQLVEGMWSGQHASVRHGSGQEFHDYRQYVSGDDLGDVDWKLYGRTDRYYVRRHRQLTDLHLYLMVDCSASMDFAPVDAAGQRVRGQIPGAITANKFAFASALAAAIAFLTIRQGDRAGLGLCAERLLEHHAPAGTWMDLLRMCRMLEQSRARNAGQVGASLAQAHALMRRRGLLVLISDLLDDPREIFDGLDRFRYDRFDVILFQVLTRQELDLSGLGGVRTRMVDAETQGVVTTDVSRVQRRYVEQMGTHLETLQRGCMGRGIDYNLLTTDQSVVTALRKYLVRRNALA